MLGHSYWGGSNDFGLDVQVSAASEEPKHTHEVDVASDFVRIDMFPIFNSNLNIRS